MAQIPETPRMDEVQARHRRVGTHLLTSRNAAVFRIRARPCSATRLLAFGSRLSAGGPRRARSRLAGGLPGGALSAKLCG